MTDVRAAIVGVSGYTGRELAHILATHPRAELVGAFRSESGVAATVGDLHPSLRGVCDLPVDPFDAAALRDTGAQVVFLAIPHKASHDLAPALLDMGLAVIDLSAAFRLSDPNIFEQTYGFRHERPDLVARAVYGLPELNADAIRTADLIASPGCYATSAILALAPLVRAGLVRRDTRPIVDAASGVSGAGRGVAEHLHFCEVSYQPYNALKHRHAPEVAEHAGSPVSFVPHLAMWERGILATCHIDLAAGHTATGADIAAAYRSAYANAPFVRTLGADTWPSIAAVRGTNFCDLGWTVDDTGHAVVCSAIDNLVKGASGQAVQSMNIRFGLDERLLGARGMREREGAPS